MTFLLTNNESQVKVFDQFVTNTFNLSQNPIGCNKSFFSTQFSIAVPFHRIENLNYLRYVDKSSNFEKLILEKLFKTVIFQNNHSVSRSIFLTKEKSNIYYKLNTKSKNNSDTKVSLRFIELNHTTNEHIYVYPTMFNMRLNKIKNKYKLEYANKQDENDNVKDKPKKLTLDNSLNFDENYLYVTSEYNLEIPITDEILNKIPQYENFLVKNEINVTKKINTEYDIKIERNVAYFYINFFNENYRIDVSVDEIEDDDVIFKIYIESENVSNYTNFLKLVSIYNFYCESTKSKIFKFDGIFEEESVHYKDIHQIDERVYSFFIERGGNVSFIPKLPIEFEYNSEELIMILLNLFKINFDYLGLNFNSKAAAKKVYNLENKNITSKTKWQILPSVNDKPYKEPFYKRFNRRR